MYVSAFDVREIRGAVRWLVIVNVLGHLIQWFVGPEVVHLFGLTPALFLQQRWVWQGVTYLFLHGSLLHLLFNLLALWMFGRVIESTWGTAEFLKYYFITGIGAGLCTVLLSPNSWIPTVGASGAIYGLLVAFAMMYPDAILYLYFFFPLKAKDAIVFFAVLEFFISIGSNDSWVASWAHLGGMFFGYAYLKGWPFFRACGWGWLRFLQGGMERAKYVEPRVKSRRKTEDLISQVDGILDKILEQGVESLTREERELMEKYSKKV